jgi:site-specific DNA recombinase
LAKWPRWLPLESEARKHLARKSNGKAKAEDLSPLNDKELFATHIARVDIKQDRLAIALINDRGREATSNDKMRSGEHDEQDSSDASILIVPWKKKPSKQPREIIAPASTSSHHDPRPIRAETRAKLIIAIARGRHWLDELIAGAVKDVEQIAAREKCSIRNARTWRFWTHPTT